MQPAVNQVRATAQNLRDKLVSTAEELLRSQTPPPPPAAPKVMSDANVVKKVIFPRIEK